MYIDMPEQVALIIKKLKSEGHEAYAVGGCVRDCLLGRIPEDWDVTTSASPDDVKRLFKRTLDTGIRHGTVTVMLGGSGYEVTTYRIDGRYTDGRHPESVEFTRSLAEDLRRRDFTINAMAYNEEDGLVDMFGGVEDLEKKLIRCVGDPSKRFGEDALRILRAVRFAAQLDFTIDPATLASAKELAGSLSLISAERIRTELGKLLTSQHPAHILTAYKAGVTKVILPEFDRMMQTPTDNSHHIYSVGMHTVKALECCPASPGLLRWTMLLHDVEKPSTKTVDKNGVAHFYGHPEKGSDTAVKILHRLKFDNNTIETVRRLVKYHDTSIYGVSDSKMRHAIRMIGDDIMEYLFTVHLADISAKNPSHYDESLRKLNIAISQYHEIKERGECLSVRQLAVNGSDLLQLGIPAGKRIGEALNKLLNMVLDNPSLNDREKLLDKARNYL